MIQHPALFYFPRSCFAQASTLSAPGAAAHNAGDGKAADKKTGAGEIESSQRARRRLISKRQARGRRFAGIGRPEPKKQSAAAIARC
jgi:hypothetical protein